MKVLLLGGYGVFGGRLALLLVRDGHLVTIAGRDLTAARLLAEKLGCSALCMDRNGDLTELYGYEVVIDAAGPFQAYGDDPYRMARAAIAAGAHYLDLSDSAAFCTGITALDADARSTGLCVLSGVSSVPAISSAAVRALTGDQVPRVIDTAILPGNRSPRGLSMMQSILSQAGKPMRVWRGGAWTPATGWSDPQDYRLPGGLRRQAWQIEVPDQTLFPAHFRAETVLFRAGLELAIMRYGLAAFAMLQRLFPIPVSKPVVRAFKLVANLLSPFGSGKGGMSVMVITNHERKVWRLLAEEGEGPFIPGVAARALLRRKSLPAGAGPALSVVTLDECEAAMQDLKVRTEQVSERFEPIFVQVLGSSFGQLPKEIQMTHLTADISRWRGRAKIRRGTSLWSRALCRLFGFPAAADDTVAEVIKRVVPTGEVWQRFFGPSRFASKLAATTSGMTERFGPFTFRLGLVVKDEALHYPVISGRLGPLPLPKWLLPVSEAREYVADGLFHFDVKLSAPIVRDLLVHYTGTLAAASESVVP